jgi:hypothetical protein
MDRLSIAALIGGVLLNIVGHRTFWYRRAKELADRRPNISQDEFVSSLAPDVDANTARWFWGVLRPYYPKAFSPHPDDCPLGQLDIDAFEPDDWTEDFCLANGLARDAIASVDTVSPASLRNMLKHLVSERARILAR